MKKDNKILVITFLYFFPNKLIKRGGIMIHNSLLNMSKAGANLDVVFYIPFVYHYVKYFKFNWRKMNFHTYKIDDITIHPVFYLPRMSKLFPLIDIFLKKISFLFFYKRKDNKQTYNLVYGQTLYPSGPILPAISKIMNTPYIVNMRGSDIHTYSAKNKYVKKQSLKVLLKAKFVLSVSKKLRDISVIIFKSNYVNHILYTVCRIDIFRNKKPFSSSLTKFIFIGALIESKGIFDLFEAFSILHKDNSKYRLTLVGEGNRKSLERLAESKGMKNIITFKGLIIDREELVDEINESDVFIFPSHNEGLPNAVVEAVACERVVICTDVGGVREITNSNSAFQIVPPKNVNSIVESVKKLKFIDEKELRKHAIENRKNVVEKFSSRAQIRSFRTIFKSLNICL